MKNSTTKTVKTAAKTAAAKATEKAAKVAETAAKTTEAAAENAAQTAKEAAQTAMEAKAAVEEKVAKRAEEVKEEAIKAEKKAVAAVKEAVKKAPAKKAAVKETVYLQYAGKEIDTDALKARVKEIWTNDMQKKAADMKSVVLYLKPEDNAAYYVINDEVSGKIDF